jgi:hypothetical protein
MDPDPSSDREVTPERAEDLLRELPQLELLGLMRRSSNYTFLARLGPIPEMLAVYKPASGESPLWDFPTGTLYRREVAAYRLARALGWPNVPPTVVRDDAPHGRGAVQLFIDAEAGRHYLQDPSTPVATWEEIALFDVVTNNADRKSGHCLAGADGRTWVIDHGLTFHVDHKLRTVIWDFAGRPLPARLRAGVERALAGVGAAGDLEAELDDLLSKRELTALRRRLASALEPGWRYPEPTSAWSVPWPPV